VIAGSFSAAINVLNQIMIWGKGEFGIIRSPQKLFMDKVEFSDCKISKYEAIDPAGNGYYLPEPSALALDASGHVYSWGCNHKGQLGHGDSRNRKLPSQILSLKRKELRLIEMGGDFTIMLGRDIKIKDSAPELQFESRPMPFDLDVLKRI